MLNLSTGDYFNSNIFRFNIATAWYKTVWFRLLVAAILLAIIFFIVRGYYMRKLQQQKALLEKEKALEAERQRIAADMHDDIGAGLSRIRYITASMKEGSHVNKEDMERILSLSDESVEKMNEIIWSLNQGNQQLEELIYYTRSQCSEMANLAGMAFTFEIPENIPAITLGWKECRNIYLLVKEAVNNAIKHSGGTSIIIECSIGNDLQFSVADNGKGFNPEAVKKTGNGFLNYKKRVEKLNGSYELVTAESQGAKLIFNIPIN
jgi:signal transduction histidine kinase